MNRAAIAELLYAGFVGVPGKALREEEHVKTDELVALLEELARSVGKLSKKAPLVLVDAAAGKGYVGLLAAKLLLDPQGVPAVVHLIERDPRRLELAREAAARLGVTTEIVYTAKDVDDASAYPEGASIVVALHACGDATDRVIERGIDARAKLLLVMPCCVGKSTRGSALARSIAATIALPKAGPVRRRMVHAVVDGERMLRLEAAGYQTDAFELVSTRVTPYNVLLRARRVGEQGRAARAREDLERLRHFAADAPDAG